MNSKLQATAELAGQETLLACWHALTRLSPGAELVQVSGATAAVFPAWAPLNNAILRGAQDPESEASATAELRQLFDAAGVPIWALWRPAPARELDAADEQGPLGELKRDTTTLVMKAALPPGLRRHSCVARASIDAVALFDDDVYLSAADLGNPEDVPGLDGWVLLHDDLVVSAAWTFLHDGDCGVFAVETLPQFRRRGYARLLMEHLLAEAQRRGATTASLQSTRMGQPLYETLGFVPVGRYEEWIWQ